MKELIFEFLKTQGYLNEIENIQAYNKIKMENDSINISGNKRGLILLAEYLVNIALSDNNFQHVHLDEINFFEEANVELIISKCLD